MRDFQPAATSIWRWTAKRWRWCRAIRQSSRTSQTVEAFGEDEPVATIPGQRTHVIELTRLYATDEAIRDGLNFHALEDFSLVICKPDRKIIYSGYRSGLHRLNKHQGPLLVEKITIVAARRIETAV